METDINKIYKEFLDAQGIKNEPMTVFPNVVDNDIVDDMAAINTLISDIMDTVTGDDDISATIRNTARLFMYTVNGKDDEDEFETINSI